MSPPDVVEEEGRHVSDPMDRLGLVLSERFKLESHISEELLGHVYAGIDLVSGRAVQVKVLHDFIHADNPKFGRFLREVRATSMVRHINTIELLDSGQHEGMHYVVMEFFDARSLEDELKGGPLPLSRAAHIAAQVANAIGAAHQENITHRALSPRNVLLLTQSHRGDFVKVRDFGLSKLEHFGDDDENSQLTEAGVRVGNTAYMAPEYIERDRFHPKGDLYALGCLLMTMLTGQPPFTGRGAEVLADHVASPPPRIRERLPSCPQWMDDLVNELLSKRPEDRAGAYQVVQRLEEGIGHRLEPPGLGAEIPADRTEEVATSMRPAPERGGTVDGMPLPVVVGVMAALGGLALTMIAVVLTLVVMMVAYWPSTVAPPREAVEVVEVVPEPTMPDEEPPPAPPVPAPTRPVPSTPADVPTVAPVQVEPAYRASIKVTSNRRAIVLLDGRPMGMTPVLEPVLPGTHTLSVMLPNQPETKQEQAVTVHRGEVSWVVITF